MLLYFFLAVFSYGIGAVPSLRLIGVRGRQPFARQASFLYMLGMKRSIQLIVIDFSKGFVATLLGLIALGWGGAALCALVVNIGALFPIFRLFSGNKNTAVAAGALLVLSPILLLIGLGIFLLSLILSRYISFATILSTVIVLILAMLYPPVWFVFCVIFLLAAEVLLLYIAHVPRLLHGKEPPFPLRHLRRR